MSTHVERSALLTSLLLALACGAKTTEAPLGPPPAPTAAGGSPTAPAPSGTGASIAMGAAADSALGGSSTSAAGEATTAPAEPPLPVQLPSPSSGCGQPLPKGQLATIPGLRQGYTEWHVTQTGATLDQPQPLDAGDRQFFVRVPADYDDKKPYRVVYLLQGCGAQHAGATNTYPLFDESNGCDEDAVYVGVSVPDNDVNPGCYDNLTGPNSQEWEAFDEMHSFVESNYCVDNNRIYAVGYAGESGGSLAEMWGCYFAGNGAPLDSFEQGQPQRKFAPHWALRGHASVAGALPDNQPKPCNGPSAGLWIHDQQDRDPQVGADTLALEAMLATNGCVGTYADGPKEPWAPAEMIPALRGGICQHYTGCPHDVDRAYPLVFCTTTGQGHSDQSNALIPLVTAFFKQLEGP